MDAEEATYENIIFNDDIANFVGTFTCEVSNVRGRVQETVELNGEDDIISIPCMHAQGVK